MEDSASTFSDWAYIPQVVVHLISEKVKSITDYVRFRAVCSPWRFSTLPKPSHLPPQLPWLMIPHDPLRKYMDCPADDGIRLFYDLWQSKMLKIHLPETIRKRCCATYRGWLLLVESKGKEIFLLNPVTRTSVELPPFTTPVKHIWDEGWDVGENLLLVVDYFIESFMRGFKITKMTFSADLTDPNCLIMVFLQVPRWIFFCQVGDHCWTHIVLPSVPNSKLADAAYSNGSFYLLYEESIFIYDLNQHKMWSICPFKPELRPFPKVFMEGKSGLYIVVVRFAQGGEEATDPEGRGKVPKQKIELYQFQKQQMEVKWIADTSDTTIFFGDNYHYLALRSDEWDLLDGGCMYMELVYAPYAGLDPKLHDCGIDPMPCITGGLSYNIFLAKLDDGNSEPVVLGLGEMPPIWPPAPAMWFQPSFV